MKRYQILEHRADLKIRVLGRNKKELFKNAMIAMLESSRYEGISRSQGSKIAIKIKSSDLTQLLVDFLNEILYLIEIKKEVYRKIKFKKFSDKEITAELTGKKLERMGTHIKALTYHGLDIRQKKGGTWEVILIFDI